MDIAIKYKIVEKVIQSKDETLLNEVKALMDLSESDFWTALPTEVKQGINRAKVELDEGLGIAHNDVINDIEKRFL